MTAVNGDAIKELRSIPQFVDYAKQQYAADADFWRREAEFGSGIMRAAAIAVMKIGGKQE
jgi:hypothetical protein